jgi:enamine deaminase RidA (YjgF/YER057c/UK114 family)
MGRKNISGNSPYEAVVGYSRAVVVGNQIFVSGTTATDENGELVGIGDSYAQAKQALQNIGVALEKAGATFKDVVRTRMFVTENGDWEAVTKAHGDIFRDIRPAATLVIVKALVDPQMLVEIEVDAVMGYSD